jgi:imidazole glycerol-phosphate synthase subunit HisH
MLAVVDYGAGNLGSVLHALNYLRAENMRVVQDGRGLKGADKIILPGVGAFGAGMNELTKRNLIQPLKEAAALGIPFLGICVGMQFLFDTSDEMGNFEGLGIIPGYVTRFPKVAGLKVPHMGWNQVRQCKECELLDGLTPDSYGYFVHSYYCTPTRAEDVAAEVDYGIPFTAIVQHKNVYGVQFHPEKSQTMGLQIYTNFLKVSA